MIGNLPSALDNDKSEILVEADPRIAFRELAKEVCLIHPTVLTHLKAIGKMKKTREMNPA